MVSVDDYDLQQVRSFHAPDRYPGGTPTWRSSCGNRSGTGSHHGRPGVTSTRGSAGSRRPCSPGCGHQIPPGGPAEGPVGRSAAGCARPKPRREEPRWQSSWGQEEGCGVRAARQPQPGCHSFRLCNPVSPPSRCEGHSKTRGPFGHRSGVPRSDIQRPRSQHSDSHPLRDACCRGLRSCLFGNGAGPCAPGCCGRAGIARRRRPCSPGNLHGAGRDDAGSACPARIHRGSGSFSDGGRPAHSRCRRKRSYCRNCEGWSGRTGRVCAALRCASYPGRVDAIHRRIRQQRTEQRCAGCAAGAEECPRVAWFRAGRNGWCRRAGLFPPAKSLGTAFRGIRKSRGCCEIGHFYGM